MRTSLPFLLALYGLLGIVSCSTEDCQHQCLTSGACNAKKFADTCYYLFNDKQRTWKENRELCASENLTMAKMEMDAIEQNFTVKDLAQGKDIFLTWLGGRTTHFSNWIITDNSLNEPIETTTLSSEEDMQECGMLHVSNKTRNFKLSIVKEDCNKRHHFICQLSMFRKQKIDEWHNTPSIYISEQDTAWLEAKSRCTDLGGDLFRLKPNDNIQHIERKLMSFPGKIFFVGLNHNTGVWEDGSDITHYNWLGDSPDKTCLMMYSWNSKWTTKDCNSTAYAFCQNKETEEPQTHSSGPTYYVLVSMILGGLLAVSIVVNIGLTICLGNCHSKSIEEASVANDVYCDIDNVCNTVAPDEKSRANMKPAERGMHAVKNVQDKGEPTNNPCMASQILLKPKESNSNPEIFEEMELLDNSFYGSLKENDQQEVSDEEGNDAISYDDTYATCNPK